jgi:hypothetical protein
MEYGTTEVDGVKLCETHARGATGLSGPFTPRGPNEPWRDSPPGW